MTGAHGPELPDDAAAAALALAGRDSGYRLLLERHRDSVFRYVRGYTGDEGEAVDLTQECFIAAFAALRRYDPARPFRPWLMRIAVNKCHDWSRRRAVRRMLAWAQSLDDTHDVADSAADPETALASAHEMHRIQAAIAALPVALREPLLLCTVEGMAQDEAAAVLKISRKAVETRIYRAREKLSHALEG